MIGGNVINFTDDKGIALRIAIALERIAHALEKGAHVNIDHAHIDEVEGKIRTHEERW
mgnify:CR=1 FL=1